MLPHLIDYDENYSTQLYIQDINDNVVSMAKEHFNRYVARGTVQSGYNDDFWTMTNEVYTYIVKFNLDNYNDRSAEFYGMTRENYSEIFRASIALSLGRLSLTSIFRKGKAIAALMNIDHGYPSFVESRLPMVIEFLECIPNKNNNVIDMIDHYRSLQNDRIRSNQRDLATINSYLEFDNALSNFWKTATDNEKIYYFPVWVWWNITSIIPLRPSEICMLPLDCLSENNGKKYLTIRRTNLKKQVGTVTYTVEGDYDLQKVRITDSIYNEFEQYLHKTKDQKRSHLNLLFPLENGKVYDANAQSKRLNAFYTNVLQNKLGYSIVLKGTLIDNLGVPSIERIHLGDTRHLAMINLIAVTHDPNICMQLAGHESVEMSSHYFSNIKEVVQCDAYDLFKRQITNSELRPTNESFVWVDDEPLSIDSGFCLSPKRKCGDFTDCAGNINDTGQIGICQSCIYYRDKEMHKPLIYTVQFAEEAFRTAVDQFICLFSLYSNNEQTSALLQSLQKIAKEESKLKKVYTMEKKNENK